MSPLKRLRDYNIDDTVTLKGAALERVAALFIGWFEGDYYLLWKSQRHFLDGHKWQCMAAGSHLVEDTKCNTNKEH